MYIGLISLCLMLGMLGYMYYKKRSASEALVFVVCMLAIDYLSYERTMTSMEVLFKDVSICEDKPHYDA